MGDEALQRRFLEQLRALEQFRITYTGQHPGLPLQQADQDIQRLLEAQAFFSARTIVAAERIMTQGTRRIFAQHLPYLLHPVPPTTMVRATIDARFVDPTVVDAGEELGVEERSRDLEDTPPPVFLRTLTPTPIRPLELSDVRFERPRPKGPAEITLRFSAAHRRRWSVSPLSLYVDHLGEFEASAAVHLALRRSLERAEIRWDGGPPLECPVRFGPLAISPGIGLDHPLDQVRAFFRLPEMDLFITLLPPPPPGEWSRFEVRLRLSETWPRGLGLEPGTLQQHVIPTVNLRRELAAPIAIDGTKSVHPVEHPDPGAGFVLRGIRGAYRVDSNEGLIPLTPGFVPRLADDEQPSSEAPAWEVDFQGLGSDRRGMLRLAAPDALLKPFRVTVDGLWHQPHRAAEVADGAPAHLMHQSLDGVGFATMGRIKPAVDANLAEDDEALLTLLGARSRSTLTLTDLQALLDVLRGPHERTFDSIVRGLSAADVQTVPSALSQSGFRYRYRLLVEGCGPPDVPKLVLFGHRIRQMLAAWSTEDVVEVQIDLPHFDQHFRFTEEEVSR